MYRREYRLKYYDKNREKLRAYQKEYGDRNRERVREYQRKYYDRTGRLRKYGLDKAAYDALFLSQGNRCAICQTNEPGGKGWCVDHDHETRQVRGILCVSCNFAIGYLHEDPRVCELAAAFLRRHGKK